MKSIIKTVLLTLALTIPLFSFCQIAIDYVNPSGFSVCDTAEYEVIITNNFQDSIKDVTVAVDFPAGVDYVVTSLNNATENNVTNLNVPVFDLPNIAAGESISFTLDGFYKCELIGNINSGVLFTNEITVNHQAGNQSTVTTPYLIETALLIITGTTNDVLTGTLGEVLTRTITIQNTRIGALSSFNLIDMHEGGIEISTDFGTVTNTGPFIFEVTLDGDDFMNIGDGDGLFELDEVITITQTILITTCGFDQNNSNSDIIVNWGCGEDICQQTQAFALVQFIPSNVNPNIVGSTVSSIPINFCAELPSPQSLIVTNNGSAMATNIDVQINQDTTAPVTAMHPNSFTIDSNNVSNPIVPELQLPIDYDGCSLNDLVYQEATIIIPFLGPGESVTISWDNYSCAQGCGSPVFGWTYLIEYEKVCPQNQLVTSSGSNAGDVPLGELMIDTVTFDIGVVITDNTTHTLDYGLESDFLDDSTGILNIEFIIPCGFKWEPSNTLQMGGQVPFSIDVQTNPGNTIVNAQYMMPMDSDSIFTNFDISFTCDAPCLPPPQFIEEYNTSCPPTDVCVGDTTYLDSMAVNTSMILDTTTSAFCAIQECQVFPLTYVCYNGEVVQIYPPGYLDFEMESLRANYDLKDDDNDRVADGAGSVDLNLVRRDRLIPGDILRTTLDGIVVMDIPDSSFSLGTVTVQIESHSIDDDIENGFWLAGQDDTLMSIGSILPIEAEIKIFDASTGANYTCSVPVGGVLYDQRATIAVPNTRPEEIIDDIKFTVYSYNISVAALQNCLPGDFRYEAGDIIEFAAQHRMMYNPKEELAGLPMIVNMRTGTTLNLSNPGEHSFTCNCPSVNWQYSPYKYRIFPGTYGMLPCEEFDSPGGQGFEILLGEGNFFPFEVRPLAYINEWDMTVPPQINILESTLLNWEVQDGATLASNVPLPTDGNYDVEFDPYQNPLIDEGYRFSLYHLFEADCYQDIPLTMTHHLNIDFADNLPEEYDPLDTTIIVNGSFYPLRPNLFMVSAQPNYVSFDNQAIWNFDLVNSPSGYQNPAENVWMTITSPTGLLHDFQLIDLNTGMAIMPQNGIYQLGTFNIGQITNFQLIAITSSCDIEDLIVQYGWDCEPYISTSDTPCEQNSYTFTVISPRGEIEMNITSPITPVELCDTIPYHTIEIFNAQIGAVFNVMLDAELPEGLMIVPGSSQLAYPSSGTFENISDPIDLGNNVYQWDISALNDSIGGHGLSGFGSAPEHSVSLRFLSSSECGFISGDQIIFTANATQNCDEATNTISKPGDILLINGVAPPYESEFFISTTGGTEVGCGDEFTMIVSMQATGTTLQNDSVFITLPPGVFYSTNSYNPISNAPVGEPNISVNGNVQILSWAIPAGIQALNPISFEITLNGFTNVACGINTIEIQSVQEQSAICSSNGELCSVLAETGSTTLDIVVNQPSVNIIAFGGVYNNGQFTFDLDVFNGSGFDGDGLNIDIYIDLDGNGILSPGDSLIGTTNYIGTIGSGTTSIVGQFDIGYEYICSLIAVVDENSNCICNSDESALQSPLSNQLAEVDACSGTDTPIGIDDSGVSTYQWSPPGNLDCPTCPTTNINIENATNDPIVTNYTLIEDLGTCVINHEIEVTILAEPGIVDNMPAMCPEGEVTLIADPGTTYNWQGTGIVNPNQQTQTVNPPVSTIYTLTITDNNNCIGTDEIEVIVHPSPDANAGPDEEYCIEDEVNLDAILNNNYSYSWSPANQLNDPNSPTATVINNVNTTYTLTVTDQNNCTATDEVTIEFDEGPELSISDDQTICNGETTSIEVSGANSYLWVPANSLNCATCPIVEANPMETTTYTVFGYNENGCESIINVVVNVTNEPLTGEEIQYLCEGDTLELFGEIIFSEGIFCDTLTAVNGCDSIHCVEVLEADFPMFDFPLDITVEDGMEVTIDLDPDYSYQWDPPGIIPDCNNCTEVTFTLDETTTFSVTVTNEEGCARTDSIQVRVFPMCLKENVELPNAFSPDGDGMNDKFRPMIPEDHLEEVHSMKIFNRWGHVVYEAEGNDACWDGTYKGKPANQDVYYYIVVVGCSLKEDIIKGDLTLFR